MRTLCVVVLLAFGLVLSGCATKAQTGALLGAGGGALAGQAIGHDTKGTLIGAGIGGLGGALAGDYLEKKENQAGSRGYNQGYQQGYQQGGAPIAYGGTQEPPGDRNW